MDIKKIEFLTPTDKDNFTEEQLEEGYFKVTFGNSYVIAKVLEKNTSNGSVSLLTKEIKHEGLYHLKKLHGYLIFKKVLPKSNL